jgi:hypothetical protein
LPSDKADIVLFSSLLVEPSTLPSFSTRRQQGHKALIVHMQKGLQSSKSPFQNFQKIIFTPLVCKSII